MKEPTVSVVTWVDPITGKETRRSDRSVRMWRYINPHYLEVGPIYFAATGIHDPRHALEVGYEIMANQVAHEVIDDEETVRVEND